MAGDCEPGEEAMDAVQRLRPDVVLMSLGWPDRDPMAVCREIREHMPTTRVLVMSCRVNAEELLLSVLAGASGYLSHDAGGPELIRAISIVTNGGGYFDWNSVRRVISKIRWSPSEETTLAATSLATLSDREMDVLALVAQGLTNRQIAERLAISANTARSHVSRILKKLKLTRRSQAATLAVQNGIVGDLCAPQ